MTELGQLTVDLNGKNHLVLLAEPQNSSAYLDVKVTGFNNR